ncbi:hypothetical protein B7494_g4680 [Chlorociboria aeruginascens]|nr:hypothetical protein B7494_g4680 [Chlorociboria aeruginascens]
MNGETKPFRVIVVGAGVGGLTSAHALSRANINYVVLERGQIAPPYGASIGIYPQGSRILEQIGVLKAVTDQCTPLGKSINLIPDGSTILSSDFFKFCREDYAHPIPVLERRMFLQILYDGLDDAEKAKVKSGKGVTDIIEDDDGVKVILEDGSIEEGDIVIGTDGVHSNVRSLMWRNANAAIPGMITAAEKKSLYCNWTALVGFSPTLPSMSNKNMYMTHYDGKSFLVIHQPKWTFWFIFFKNPETLYWPSRPRYTQADADAKAVENLECPISDTQVFGELWKSRVRGELVNVEEGLFKHMYFGRIMTPNVGLGGNTSMESVAVLANLLNKAIKSHPRGKPGKTEIEAIFAQYQAERLPRVKKIIEFSGLVTKIQAWDSILLKVASRILPFMPERTLANETGKIIKAAPKLDYITLPVRPKGKVGYDDEKLEALGHIDISKSMLKTTQVPLLGLFVVLSSCIYLLGYAF